MIVFLWERGVEVYLYNVAKHLDEDCDSRIIASRLSDQCGEFNVR